MEKRYPVVEVDLKKLRHNIDEILSRCAAQGISVTGVVKGFNGIVPAARQFEESGCIGLGSSRLEHLEEARKAGCKKPMLALRVPMLSEIPDLVRICDISLNSEVEVLKAIDAECAKQKKKHDVILMADLGDLREGFWDKDEMTEAAVMVEKELENVHLLGIGVNLGCYGSINPTVEKMNDLIAIAEKIEAAIGRKLEIISGGATTSLPLVLNKIMPERINHLRCGEGILLGYDLQNLWGVDMSFLNFDVFTVKAEIVELKEKPSHPVGEIFVDWMGNKVKYEDKGIRKKALVGLGKLDVVYTDALVPRAQGIEILGGSSDHLILDLNDDPVDRKVGDILEFDVRYSTMMYTTASQYLRVEIIG
ncbi:MAG: alanine racemase [Defluviitaleaceae bacterium]|nr:alanine racemase [Defluviitaleaceae bacterium]